MDMAMVLETDTNQWIGDEEVDEEGNVYEDNEAKRRRDEDDHEESFEHPAKRIREEARLGIEKQASRMVERSKRKLKPGRRCKSETWRHFRRHSRRHFKCLIVRKL